ncbi:MULTISPECIES: DEAD/DEAH box helicase [unclassified Sphingobium]|uniref:DEAD/DEAH box helicase n=1 Tax=unclassified Sphingobium TaxID=2611147 RepID=UPI0022243BB4|nr:MULTISPECIES: ATP-binding domain-containing protein [unclassified Sphingobium]MCW2411374.1 superfamily I DNA and RNA helicase [Sphingobium sp. B8D3D]MCW2416333.1 superfamily I DNA and RNA helicase [Sphingobium sp. B8D3A]
MIDTVWGSTKKPVAARQLAETLSHIQNVSGTLYIGYPIIGTPDGAFPFDALLLSPEKGAVAFDLVEGRELGDFQDRQDDLYAKLHSKLLQYPALVKRRTLAAPIHTITFAPALPGSTGQADAPVTDTTSLPGVVDEIAWQENQSFSALASAIQALTTIRKSRHKRTISNANSRGAKLHALNESIATLDANQNAAVVETVAGVQRIRGLAGSGKTIVLALKVAYLHAQNPDWLIAVTFNTRSLKGQFERLITSFVYEQTSEEPDWSKIRILHSWGSANSPGIYYNFTKDHELTYRDFRSAQSAFGEGKEFSGATEEAINHVSKIKGTYDAILVDEAQDLPSSFLRLCHSLLKPPHRLVYAYDELQSLTNASLPGPEELFGNDAAGNPLVEFSAPVLGEPRQDIILEKCYRNSRPVLATAHALGFGIYREPDGLIQIFEQNQLWQDVGYRVRDGALEDGHFVSLERTSETSPIFLENHSPIDDLIQFHAFNSRAEQDDWLTNSIIRNIQEDELLPEDIVVINPDPLKTRKIVGSARSILLSAGINSSLAGVSTSPDVFFEKDVVTFTGIFRAKGNEAGMIYIVNADDCFDSPRPTTRALIRNRLFTAITRSKAWVRVLGVGPGMEALREEFERVKQRQFRLDFVYPDEQKKKALRIINRDLTRTERKRLDAKVSDLASAIEALESGDVLVEDLPEALRRRLKELFSS